MSKKKFSFHEAYDRDEHVEGSSDRNFGLVFAMVFAIVSLWPLVGGSNLRLWALAIAGVFALVAMVRPDLLAPLNRLWLKFGLLLARFVSPIFLGLVYFAAVLPTGFIMRWMFGADPLRLKREPESDSYWIIRDEPGPEPDSLKNQF